MTRRRQTRQRGFALLSVLIISAILVLSAFMFTSQLASESHITRTDALFKSALSEAEAGLSTVLAMVRTGKSPDATSWAAHLGTLSPIPAIIGTDSAGGVRGAYVVKATVVTSGTDAPSKYRLDSVVTDPVTHGTTTTEYWTGKLDVTASAGVYPPSVATMVAGSSLSAGYSARRAITTRAQVSWTKTVGTGPASITTFGVDYGVFTGGDLSIKGASSEWHGDVYAAGNAYIQKNSSVVGGEVYASGTITGNPPGTPHPSVTPPIPFPEIDTAAMHAMANAYIAGTWPYDGTKAGYTNTSDPVKRAQYSVDLLAADPTNTAYFLDPTAVYYVEGSMQLNGGSLSGTIVINGDVRINGNVLVGSTGTLPTIIATGNVTKENGCSEINGIVYTGGTFTGNGTAQINGALIARGTVAMNGTLDVYYEAGLGDIVIGGNPGETSPPLYGLSDIVLPSPASGRIWQEVVPN